MVFGFTWFLVGQQWILVSAKMLSSNLIAITQLLRVSLYSNEVAEQIKMCKVLRVLFMVLSSK